MAGADLTYPGRITSLSMQIWGWDFQMLGEGNAQGPGYRAMTGDYPQIGIHKKLVLKEERVVGALLLGNIGETTLVESLIRDRAEISQVDQRLLRKFFDSYYWRSSGLEVPCPGCKLNVKLEEGAKEGDLITYAVCGVGLRLVRQNGGFRAVRA